MSMQFLRDVAGLAYANPFTPERVAMLCWLIPLASSLINWD